MIKIGFDIAVEEGVDLSSTQLADDLRTVLPKEWWGTTSEVGMDGIVWVVNAIFPLNDDGTPKQFDSSLRPKPAVDWERTAKMRNDILDQQAKRIHMLTAELAQERKLVAHLEEKVTDQGMTVSGQAGTIQGQKRRIEIAERKYDDANELNKNVVEKNDNQSEMIRTAQNTIRVLQKKYDDGLIDWTIMRDLRNGLQNRLSERDKDLGTAIDRADRNYATLGDVTTEREALKAELAKANGEAQAHANMIGKIVDAMEGAGYDISGWGNDVELEELETAIGGVTNGLEDASSEASIITQKLDEIRTRR